MQRNLYRQLLFWKKSPYRKPLVLHGARQVGKTYLMNAFGNHEYKNCVVLNCDKDDRIAEIFEHGFRTDRIIADMEVISGQRILPEETLIFIDEVGSVPKALASLKYFCEDAPQYHIAAAGSLLGLAIHQGVSYPVGKVNEFTLYPVSFDEFVREKLGETAYLRLMKDPFDSLSSLRSVLNEALREYYFTGGMPEVVQGFLDSRPYEDLRKIQKQILADYTLDISKHAGTQILGRIHQVWNSIPQQLARSNSRFIYGDIQKGARAKDFELAIQWLLDAGIVYKIPRVRKAGIPLKYYEDFSAFKLFTVDHGLMGAQTDAPIDEILLKQNVFEEYKGTFTEQYVLEQLLCSFPGDIFYYQDETSKLELDFLIQANSTLIPIEVKAEENLQAKSLKQFFKIHPDSRPVRISMSDYRKEETLTNLPLYVACRIPETAK